MEQRTSKYTIGQFLKALALSCLLTACLVLPASAQGLGSAMRSMGSQQNSSSQRPQRRPKTEPEIEYPLFNGLDIGVDILGPAMKLFGSDNMSAEAFADLDIKHRYFPTVELGYGKSDQTNDYDTRYHSTTPYVRIGADYNVLWKKKHGNMFLIGLRYGFGTTTYDIDTPTDSGSASQTNLYDPVWKDITEYYHHGMKSNMHWIEFCAGVRVKVSGPIYMGWNIRLKYKLSATTGEFGDPYYIGGYGRYKSNVFGVTYSIIYKLPVKF